MYKINKYIKIPEITEFSNVFDLGKLTSKIEEKFGVEFIENVWGKIYTFSDGKKLNEYQYATNLEYSNPDEVGFADDMNTLVFKFELPYDFANNPDHNTRQLALDLYAMAVESIKDDAAIIAFKLPKFAEYKFDWMKYVSVNYVDYELTLYLRIEA